MFPYAHLCGLQVLSGNGAHLLPVAVTKAWVEQSGNQPLQFLEVVHTSLSLCAKIAVQSNYEHTGTAHDQKKPTPTTLRNYVLPFVPFSVGYDTLRKTSPSCRVSSTWCQCHSPPGLDPRHSSAHPSNHWRQNSVD